MVVALGVQDGLPRLFVLCLCTCCLCCAFLVISQQQLRSVILFPGFSVRRERTYVSDCCLNDSNLVIAEKRRLGATKIVAVCLCMSTKWTHGLKKATCAQQESNVVGDFFFTASGRWKIYRELSCYFWGYLYKYSSSMLYLKKKKYHVVSAFRAFVLRRQRERKETEHTVQNIKMMMMMMMEAYLSMKP